MMFSTVSVEDFCNQRDYDIRKTGNARWIDQKCTPDVLWSISDFVLNYVDNVSPTFTVKDIWTSEYAKQTLAETFSKPGTDERSAENEYDKVFSQPLCLLAYSGIIEDIGSGNRHLYRIADREMLEYIALNDICTLRFLQGYIESVLVDSGLMQWFSLFFKYQDNTSFTQLKNHFIEFYHDYTPVQKDYEPKRIFTKVLNPLAYKYGKCGTEHGRLSPHRIIRSDLMYNRDNFRDVYADKPKEVSRKDWLESHPEIDVRRGYFEQIMNRSKKYLKEFITLERKGISELTYFNNGMNDMTTVLEAHHIFPKNEFPEIMHYLENLIMLTPNQHYGYAHPNRNTQIVDMDAQREILIAKTCSVRQNIEADYEMTIFDFDKLLHVLHTGWDDNDVLEIEENDFESVIHSIEYHYDNAYM